MSLRNSKYWDRQFEEELPECRLSEMEAERQSVTIQGVRWTPIFCASCAKRSGLVTLDGTAFTYYLCDVCNDKFNPPPGVIQIPEEAAGVLAIK
jgi:hypothetical protein